MASARYNLPRLEKAGCLVVVVGPANGLYDDGLIERRNRAADLAYCRIIWSTVMRCPANAVYTTSILRVSS